MQVAENTTVTLTPDALGSTLNDWLGRSQFNDPFFLGQFDEFRIWDGAMTPTQVRNSFTVGPNVPFCGLCIQIRPAANKMVTISWPASAVGFSLQSSTVLGPNAFWSPVSQTPVPVGDQLQVTVPADQSSAFFQLGQ
jgi:hypothetical protein